MGEYLAALKLTVKLADEVRGRGEPYGPVTLQIVRAAQRETQIYDRNRESLFDVLIRNCARKPTSWCSRSG